MTTTTTTTKTTRHHALDQPDDIDDVTDRLSDHLHNSVPRAALRTRVGRGFAALEHVTIREFVPLFVERRVRAELRLAR